MSGPRSRNDDTDYAFFDDVSSQVDALITGGRMVFCSQCGTQNTDRRRSTCVKCGFTLQRQKLAPKHITDLASSVQKRFVLNVRWGLLCEIVEFVLRAERGEKATPDMLSVVADLLESRGAIVKVVRADKGVIEESEFQSAIDWLRKRANEGT